MIKESSNKIVTLITYILLILLAMVFIFPILVIFMNSFKGKMYISNNLFEMLNSTNFVGFANYITGFTKMNFWQSFYTSLFISVCGTMLIVIFCSMAAWYIVRVNTKITKAIYFLFVIEMVVPFQMVMFTMSWISNRLNLDTPIGLLFLCLGFGSGLSVFMFSGFVKSLPIDMEEAAMIDGCTPIQLFFLIVFPLLSPTAITVAILNVMWLWNDYLLPLLALSSEYSTLPIAIQKSFTGSYGGLDMGGLMAMLVLTITPIIIFYLFAQKHIIKGVTAGAVKG